MRKLWVSCEKFTVLVVINKEKVIVEAAPIIKTFIQQPIDNLTNWIERKWPNSLKVEDLSKMKRVSSPAKTMRRRQLACSRCGDKIKKGRRDLGYKTCLKCGEQAALKEVEAKKEKTAVLYNKGAYQYITPGLSPKSFGRKN